MAHPLNGANLGTLAAVIGRSGLPQKPLQGAMIGLSSLARAPFSLAEKVWLETRLPDAEAMVPPVFILGHWRSGTTHLYNLMTKSDEWGYVPPVATGLPWDLFGLGRLFKPVLERALPSHRYIDNIPVNPDSPQEDEIALANMSPLSFYYGIYFPSDFADYLNRGIFFDGCTKSEIDQWEERLQYLMRKLYLYNDEKPMLIKNPVYTARLAQLRRLFPTAKFIHIHRNPHQVFRSMQNFYTKLLGQFALQGYDHVNIDEAILSIYPRMMHALEKDAEGLSDDQFIEIGYDALDTDPIGTVENIYRALNLPGFETSRPQFEAYLNSVQSFEKNKFEPTQKAGQQVNDRWGYFLNKWGYENAQ